MIGKIAKVPLREIWKHEAHDFTTWLEENIEVLRDQFEFELQNIRREHTTGNFNVDLVAEDEDGHVVVIENQLEKSNHDHLGKVLTYLAAVDAHRAIWIVSEARQEHIKAMTWLNESGLAEFYLLKVEGIRIDDSKPAPLFTTIVKPSEEVREAGETKKEYAERHYARKNFWTFLLEQAKTKTKLHAKISPGIYNWIGAGSGFAGITYNYSIAKQDGKIELYIDYDKNDGKDNKRIFDLLLQRKDVIEQAFGETLLWERLDNKRASRITKLYSSGGYADEDNWPVVAGEMTDGMVRLERALTPELQRVRTML